MEQDAAPSPLEPASAFSDLPALNWRDNTGVRAFYCDAFISHRRDDASAKLVTRLAERGARAWHDKNADLSHRSVRDHIRFALSSSRTIIACVSGDKPVSGWCRAEYQPGLQAGEKANFERVIVVVCGQDAFIPEELNSCSKFLASDIDQLAQRLRDANRLPLVNESAIRSWLQPNLALGDLPFDEIAILGKQRLDVLANNESDDPSLWHEWVADLVARDLGVPTGEWLDDNPVISPTVEAPLWGLYNHLGSALLRRSDVLARLAPSGIDFVLAPLGWLQTKPAYAKQACHLIALLCLKTAENSKYAQRLAAWLMLSEAISKNSSLADARWAMQTALDDVHETEEHLENVEKSGSPDESDKARRRSQELQREAIERCRLAVAKSTPKPN